MAALAIVRAGIMPTEFAATYPALSETDLEELKLEYRTVASVYRNDSDRMQQLVMLRHSADYYHDLRYIPLKQAIPGRPGLPKPYLHRKRRAIGMTSVSLTTWG